MDNKTRTCFNLNAQGLRGKQMLWKHMNDTMLHEWKLGERCGTTQLTPQYMVSQAARSSELRHTSSTWCIAN